ncbi:MAG: DUF2274 domain-containing protein [Mesorhizobium sp.]|nr:MAG: DUF2274 domain-containing protein [Mesorhizobium sp.]
MAPKLHVHRPIARCLGAPVTILTHTGGATMPIEPAKLIVPMIERFMATDRAFTKARRNAAQSAPGSAERSG